MLCKQLHASLLYIVTFLRWVITGVLIGALCGLVGALFALAVEGATRLREQHDFLLYLLPLGGLLIAGLYRLLKLPLPLETANCPPNSARLPVCVNMYSNHCGRARRSHRWARSRAPAVRDRARRKRDEQTSDASGSAAARLLQA